MIGMWQRQDGDSRRRVSKRGSLLLIIGSLAVIIVTLAVFGPPRSSRPAPRSSASTSPSASLVNAENACYSRQPADGDVYVRQLAPGSPWSAQQFQRGNWDWDATAGQCLSSVQVEMLTAPTVAGMCTQVGYVSQNPGYDVNAIPAPPLKDVAAEKGPAC
jgi:hypothetical protein